MSFRQRRFRLATRRFLGLGTGHPSHGHSVLFLQRTKQRTLINGNRLNLFFGVNIDKPETAADILAKIARWVEPYHKIEVLEM